MLIFQVLQEAVVGLPELLHHVEQLLDFEHDVHIPVFVSRQRLGDVLELVLELVAALQRLVELVASVQVLDTVGGPDGIGRPDVLSDGAGEIVHAVAVPLDKPAGVVVLQAADGLGDVLLVLRVLDVRGLLLDGCLQLLLAVGEAAEQLHGDHPTDCESLVVRFQIRMGPFTFRDV